MARLRADRERLEPDTPVFSEEVDLPERAIAWIRANPNAARREMAALEAADL